MCGDKCLKTRCPLTKTWDKPIKKLLFLVFAGFCIVSITIVVKFVLSMWCHPGPHISKNVIIGSC